MDIHVKRGQVKTVDPKRPETAPGYKQAIGRSKELMSRMTFENEGQRKDYLRAVASNPNNVQGVPVFYPPEGSEVHTVGINEAHECVCGGCAIATDGYICPRCGKQV